MDVVGVSKARTSGSAETKKGRVSYRGNRIHWYVYYYDDEGNFRKKRINIVEVPYYGSLIRRRKSFLCPWCGTKFRSLRPECPSCGGKSKKVKKSGGHKSRSEPLKDLEDLENPPGRAPPGHSAGSTSATSSYS